jgi:hypothetical protein
MNGSAGNGLYAERHFQNAYTTRDIDAATRMFAERHGIASFHFMRDIPFGPGATTHIALAWAGDVMIELIQPNGEAANLYSTMLPADNQLLRFHHLGHLMGDDAAWQRVVDLASRSRLPIAMQGNSHGVNYLYLDARAELGHYLEYVYLTGDAVHLFDPVPHH